MLAEKFGVTIDWTAENIMPTVTNVLVKYRTYEIVRGFGSILVAVICVAIAVVIGKKMYKAYNGGNNNIFWDARFNMLTTFGIAVCVFGGIALIASIIAAFCNIGNLMKWWFVPELKYIELIKDFM